MAQDKHRVRHFSVGTVFADSLSLYFRNFFALVTVVLIIFLPVLVHVAIKVHEVRTMDPAQLAADLSESEPMILQLIEVFLLRPLITVIITVALFHALIDRPVSFYRSTQIALGRLPAAIGVLVLKILITVIPAGAFGFLIAVAPDSNLGPLGGLVLLVLGIIMLAVAALIQLTYFVAESVAVVEERGPVASLHRSAALTKGSRSALFGLSLLIGVLAVVLGLIPVLGGRTIRALVSTPGDAVAIVLVLQAVCDVLITGFGAVVTTVCYYHLRRSKEPLDVEKFVAAFET